VPTPAPPTRFSLKLGMQTAFRGGTKDWSNRFFFTGTPPPDDTHWATLTAALVAFWKASFPSSTTIATATRYLAGSEVPVGSSTPNVAGIVVPAGGSTIPPLETAALMRFATDQRTVKNHPIYLFKYIHNCVVASGTDKELLETGYKGDIQANGDGLVAGISDGSVTHVLCGPYGAVAQSCFIDPYVTHRDFPRH